MSAVTDEMIEAGAKAAYELWQNVPACTASKSWEERDRELPGSTAFFRKLSRRALEAALSALPESGEAVAVSEDLVLKIAAQACAESQESRDIFSVSPFDCAKRAARLALAGAT